MVPAGHTARIGCGGWGLQFSMVLGFVGALVFPQVVLLLFVQPPDAESLVQHGDVLLHWVSHNAFMSQHGDEDADDLIIVLGPPLIIDLEPFTFLYLFLEAGLTVVDLSIHTF